jgi:preprotein translocase subunit SecF
VRPPVAGAGQARGAEVPGDDLDEALLPEVDPDGDVGEDDDDLDDGDLDDSELLDAEGPDAGFEGGGTPDADPEDVTEEELVEEEVERVAARARPARDGSRNGAFSRLYRGETSFDFVGRRKVWLTVSSIIILAGIVSLGVRGLNLGITFKGGEAWTVPAPGVTQVQALNAVQKVGLSQPTVEILGTGGHEQVRVTADLNSLSATQRRGETTKVIDALARLGHVHPNVVSVTSVGPTWGGQVTQKAVIALIVFLVLVAVYISIRFEPKMAVAAFVALLHDLLITAGVYSLAGFQVTPDTVIAVLTILGYSLYDTVVVFDRVRDNTKGLGATGRMTYSEMVNLSMNQTLARSINTSLVAILPVLSVLLIGAELLGATTLQNYGLALFVGLLSGAYSSIFIASPILAWLKEREPRYVAMRQRIESKGERLGLLTPRAAAAMLGGPAGGGTAGRAGGRAAAARSTLRPGQARSATRAGSRGPAAATATLDPQGSAQDGGGARNGSGAAPARPGAGRPAAQRRPPQRPRKRAKGRRRR